MIEAQSPDVVHPSKLYELDLTAAQICERLDDITRASDAIVWYHLILRVGCARLPCCSISIDSGSAFIIAFDTGQGSHFTLDDEVQVWTALSRMLYDDQVPKCLQNSLYDRFVLAYRYRIIIRNITEDTMVKHWELFCEFEKSLGFQASYYTKEPYYKSERKAQTNREFWTYCCKDSAITKEVCDIQDSLLSSTELPYAKEHYRFNMALLNLFFYMEIRGIRYDAAKAREKSIRIQAEIYQLQHTINTAILGPSYLDGEKILEIVCIKKRPGITSPEDVLQFARTAYRPVALRVGELLATSSSRPLTAAEKGELSFISDTHFNCESSPQKVKYLYQTRKFPEQRHRTTRVLTSNYEALLNIYKKTNDVVVGSMLSITSLLTRVQMLRIHPDEDGRIRCGYNLVGAETGRITCYTSPTGSGYNLQTIPNEDRDLYLADEDHYIFQCDLAGADAWTVACWCWRMGDATMLDDLSSGIKIAKVVALMFLRGPEVSNLHRDELKLVADEIRKDDPIYFGSKCVQHATNYDAKAPTISATIFTQSEGHVNIPAAECGRLQAFYNRRYPGLQRWKNFAQNQLLHVGRITAASGHTRVFYGDRRDHHTFKAFLAHEPQANTTFATNLAALRLWKDPANRDAGGGLIIEPLHQVHDALLGQFPIPQTDACCERIGHYFANPLSIAGRTVVIPFEGAYGLSWKDTSAGRIVPLRLDQRETSPRSPA